MRLLNTETLRMEEFFEANLPPYAILSHTWEKEEVLLPDMADLAKARQKAGFAKIKGACALARRQQYEYIWIDTCCIDKSSSAELSEAINSMYRWYQESDVCYAYLCDVVLGEDLTTSRWFTRGWTLQELIAPGAVEFYSGAWELIGTENDEAIMDAVSRVTGIDPGILSGWLELSEVSIAQKMSWASKRVTTRPEDEAYCLMGLFDVNMPLIYGEGSRAFRRLQEEIVTRCPYDQSILAWYSLSDDDYLTGSLLAHSPKVFEKSGGIFPIPRRQSKGGPETAITLTSQWMDLSGLIFTMSTSDDGPGSQRPDTCCFGQYLQPWPPTDMTPSDLLATDAVVAILDCQLGTVPGTYPALFLQRSGNGSYSRLLWTGQGVVRFSLHDSASLSDDRSMLGISPFRASREKPLLFNNSSQCYATYLPTYLVTYKGFSHRFRKLPMSMCLRADSLRDEKH
ncbi:heterokaryon incompatibility protein-domain-containing protein [Cercophora scortea]|uniref:Heterokaryon incompatibility protein-domain-containing protein n=1 Tax=Cercophora scortea TaxID=314031 RepID=A0AAE0IZZ8_9PEZI|nr:heterokaryon incompatibility protein-domain-containing protein [Cercophora scortea]